MGTILVHVIYRKDIGNLKKEANIPSFNMKLAKFNSLGLPCSTLADLFQGEIISAFINY